jgi:hypothetical protein
MAEWGDHVAARPFLVERADDPRCRGGESVLGQTVGWRFEGMPMEGGTYRVKDGEALVGGIMSR